MAENHSPYDLNALARGAGPVDVSVSPQETPDDANHRRWKDRVMFLASLGCLLALFLTCLYVLVFGNQSPEEKKIWAGALVSLASGMVGYAIGKK
jgi:hypothetical protein